MEDMLIGVTDRTVLVFIPDPASTTGAGKTGLNAAAVTVTYTRVETDNDVVHNDVTSSVNDLSALTDAHNDWGWKEVNNSLSKGLYRLDLADAVFAAGAWYAVVQVTITSGTAAATPKVFRLIARNDLADIAQTGDGYAIVNSGTHGNAALKTLIDAIDDFIDTEVAAILEDTGTTLDDLVDDLEGRLTAALATALQAHGLGIGRGVVDAGSTTTAVKFKTVNGAAPSGTDDFYNGRHIVFTSGALTLQATSISDYTGGATLTATVPALTGAPAEDVTFIIV